MPLSEKIRIEIFIPDLPDPIYGRILEEFGDELSYAFGGCTVVSTSGKYRSDAGLILPDRINILFTGLPRTATHLARCRQVRHQQCPSAPSAARHYLPVQLLELLDRVHSILFYLP